MATINFLPIGQTDHANIYVRLSIDRKNVFKRKTGYTINPKHWSKTKKEPKQSDDHLKKLKDNLDKLKINLYSRYNEALSENIIVDADWLQKQIDIIQKKHQPEDENRLINHFQTYIDYLPQKRDSKRKKPISKATISKYTQIRKKVIAFEKHSKKLVYIRNVDLKFNRQFIAYLKKVEKLSDNTVGRYITFVKTVCNDAKIYGIETNSQLDAIKGFTDEPEKIHFNFDELEQIEHADIVGEALTNARDWLIIGCYLGQRVSDLLVLNEKNVVEKNGIELIELTQQKTGKQIIIPIHQKIKEILNKRDGEFPRKISAQKFNEHIKKVAKSAGLDEMTKGAIMQKELVNKKEEYRKLEGVFPKHELVTSHICRRSFASNYYGEMPTALIITITGHGSESQFLEYVGKPPIDHAQQIAEYLNLIYQKQQGKPRLKVKKRKKVN